MSGTEQLEHSTIRERTAHAVTDTRLRTSIKKATSTLAERKAGAYAQIADVERLRAAARSAKAEILARLPEVLDRLATELERNGVHVHWAADADEANAHVLEIARSHGVRTVVKSKSMLSEETGVNHVLEEAGIQITESDLGEWIIQVAGEAPSHIIVPAIHKDRGQVRDALQDVTTQQLTDDPDELCAFARATLRQRFLEADMGISGVNFGVAETGSIVLVTNEGNGRMTTSVPPLHVAMLGMERVVETWEQLDLTLALLPRAATGQAITTYVSAISGPRGEESHGPEEVHVVIVDNGRSDILGTEYTEMLACLRCGACLNACPVYNVTGGHAYGWVYPGPMGAVLTPLLSKSEGAADLPNASSLCGACWEACPVAIPLQDMLLALRRRHAESADRAESMGWAAWAEAWSRPSTYRASLRGAGLGSKFVDVSKVPGLAARGAEGREMPSIARRSFRDWWKEERS